MTTIRPNLYPQTQTRPQDQDSAKLAAQRAFFSAALSQAQGAAAPSTTQGAAPAVSSAPAQAPRTAAAPPEQAQKILRPGSLLDIRV